MRPRAWCGFRNSAPRWVRISTSCRARTQPCSVTWRMSVTSNVAPRLCSEFHLAWQKGDVKTALKLHDKLMPLHNNLFIESNPAPVKYALSLLGKMEEKLRLPMVPVSEPTRVAVRSAMVHAGLIN